MTIDGVYISTNSLAYIQLLKDLENDESFHPYPTLVSKAALLAESTSGPAVQHPQVQRDSGEVEAPVIRLTVRQAD
jgi:hypothetical protein